MSSRYKTKTAARYDTQDASDIDPQTPHAGSKQNLDVVSPTPPREWTKPAKNGFDDFEAKPAPINPGYNIDQTTNQRPISPTKDLLQNIEKILKNHDKIDYGQKRD